MVSCGAAGCGADTIFDATQARRDLDAYRRRGPGSATARLLAALRRAARDRADAPAETLLDVGGGVGVIAHELLGSGVTRAVLVEASAACLAAAREEGDRRGTGAHLRLLLGDAVALAPDLPTADVVTLDKVVCCYADLDALLAASAARARRLCGLVYPADRWWVRLAVAGENGVRRLQGGGFRSFVHPAAAIDAALARAGLALHSRHQGAWWVTAVYQRHAGGRSRGRAG